MEIIADDSILYKVGNGNHNHSLIKRKIGFGKFSRFHIHSIIEPVFGDIIAATELADFRMI